MESDSSDSDWKTNLSRNHVKNISKLISLFYGKADKVIRSRGVVVTFFY